jgi:hypothetical protein
MIQCGHCKGGHPTVADVKKCSQSEQLVPSALRTFTEQDERDMQRMEAEGDRLETERDEAAKAAWKASVETPSLSDLIHEVRELLVTKVAPASERRYVEAMKTYLQGTSVTAFALQTAIQRLRTFPNCRAGSAPVTEEGLYRLNRNLRIGGRAYWVGDLFQVLKGKDSGRLYAKLVVFPEDGSKKRPTLTYVSGMIFQLDSSELVPADEVQEITRNTGWCVFGHFLTNPESVKRGMGPTCYARYPHLAKNAA